jgi:hypothetical protein
VISAGGQVRFRTLRVDPASGPTTLEDHMHTRRLRIGGAVAVIAFAVLLGACGGGSSGDRVASAGGKSASQSSKHKGKPSKAQKEEAGRKFAQCMREHGIDVPDPQFDQGGGPVVFNGSAQDQQPPKDPAKFEQANKDCQHFIKDVVNGSGRKPDPAEQKKMQQQALAFAKCMREHGVDMPDPKFQDGGAQITMGGADPNDPKVKQANDTCAKKAGLPKPGGKSPGGGVQTATR